MELPKIPEAVNESGGPQPGLLVYPNTKLIRRRPFITGNSVTDEFLCNHAEARGYQLRQTVIDRKKLQAVVADETSKQFLLQPPALTGWYELQKAAAADGVVLCLESAYRSIPYQRLIFFQQLARLGLARQRSLQAELSTTELDPVLSTIAPPGYSKHHNGYTIDLGCGGGGLEDFVVTPGFEWIIEIIMRMPRDTVGTPVIRPA